MEKSSVVGFCKSCNRGIAHGSEYEIISGEGIFCKACLVKFKGEEERIED